MDVIRLLPDNVANQIAAGEVIQRPSSCLKELVENSLDAGAKHIQVIVRDAGRTLLQVIDDGCGMSEMDARLSFERHATSKIKQAKDLFSLRTMGFRGEALASICAVAQVEMMTRRAEDEVGTLIPEVSGMEELGVAVGGATTQPTSKVITRSQLAITGNSFFLFIMFSLSKNFAIIIP
jgi:DNA mismatch repair protein MutL